MKIKYYLSILIVLFSFVKIHSQTSTQNYILTRTYTTADASRYMEAIQYFDGLGRPMQTVQRGITPNAADLVTYQEYDAFGRESNSWLPAVASGNNGAYMPFATYKAKAMTTYANDSAYSRLVYEASPLNRVLEQYGPGKEWYAGRKAIRTGYLTNKGRTGTSIFVPADSLACALYKTVDDIKTVSLSRIANYNANELYVTRLRDEDGNISYEYKDKLGQVILTRQMNSDGVYDTNYIYDSYGNLRAVLPPEASDRLLNSSAWLETDATLKQYAYLYKYDTRNRCIWKKLPGCEPIYYVYDKADRLIFTQDGEQRAKTTKEWTFTIPDAFGRVVLTGICKDTIPVSNKVVKGVYASTGSYKRYNIQVDGVNKTFTNSPSILSVNFYDNYDFRGMAEIPASGTEYNGETGYGTWYGTDYTDANKHKNKGILTGTLTGLMNADGTVSTTYLYSVMYYDNRGRLIQTKSNNHLTGGIEKEYIAYNFTGQPTQKKHIHQATGKNTQTEVYTYTYDHAGRLLTTTHQLTDGTTVKPQVTVAENTYDDLGRLKTNKKGGQANLNTTYAYNIRSWTSNITNAQFNEALTYSYNGNISSMQWGQAGKTRKYNFTYDNLSRLKTAAYTGESPTNFATSYSYDKHGNIKTLQRYGMTAASTYGIIDNLTAEHIGNQLKYITDAGPNITLNASMDFKDYTKGTGIEYTYNANGAMVKDLNKGISAITYNSLNLPRIVDIKNQNAEGRNEYTYSASGQKLKAVQKWNPNYTTAPVIGSDINVSSLTMSSTTDYVGNIIYENNALKRILVDGGYNEGGNYYFYINDHLGNNRIVANAAASVVQSTQYYPFGMPFADATGQDVQPYKYNNKELDSRNGLNWYDYSARYLSLDIPVLPTVDPHAENYYSWSPYAYVGNNPIRRVDPNGKDWWDKLKGVLVAVGDNASFGLLDLRNELGQSVTDAKDYNTGQNIGDALSIISGSAEVSGGTGNVIAGGAVTIGSGGTASVVSVPVAVIGGVQIAHGVSTALNGANNLASQKGRISEANSNSSGGKGSNHLKPSPEATGDHSSFRRGADGKITNTATYKQNPKNPTGFDEVKRVDKVGSSHKNKAGQEIPTPHVHDKAIKDVRTARPDELPK